MFTELTKDEVIGQSIFFFLAGKETISRSIAFFIYNLTLNPDIQEKVHEEITSIAGDEVRTN